MSDSIKIKNCPFIHDEQNVTVIKTGEMFTVFCTICGASGPAVETPEGAIAEWASRETVIIPDSVYKELLESKDGEEEA
jgi:hypothetical protein